MSKISHVASLTTPVKLELSPDWPIGFEQVGVVAVLSTDDSRFTLSTEVKKSGDAVANVMPPAALPSMTGLGDASWAVSC